MGVPVNALRLRLPTLAGVVSGALTGVQLVETVDSLLDLLEEEIAKRKRRN